jgi:hypothetical protein
MQYKPFFTVYLKEDKYSETTMLGTARHLKIVLLRQFLDNFIRDWKEFKKKFHCLYFKKIIYYLFVKIFSTATKMAG